VARAKAKAKAQAAARARAKAKARSTSHPSVTKALGRRVGTGPPRLCIRQLRLLHR
jgi:hypothetical protein